MTQRQKHILVVEDDTEIAEMVTKALVAAGFTALAVVKSEEVRAQFLWNSPDLVLLDIMLPGDSGIEILQQIRENHDTPIIMLTAMTEVGDKVNALQLGADDYLAKPFNTQELLARIGAVLRRAKQSPIRPRNVHLAFDGWQLDPISRTLTAPNKSLILLTSAEFDLIRVLCEYAGQVLSRDRLVMLTQKRHVEPYDRSVDILISRVRQKIEQDPAQPKIIKTVRNGGYILASRVLEVTS